MCDICSKQRDEFSKAKDVGKLHSKANKGTQYKFVREYEKVFKDDMGLTLAKTTEGVLRKMASQMGL
jgi:hypothetical protein